MEFEMRIYSNRACHTELHTFEYCEGGWKYCGPWGNAGNLLIQDDDASEFIAALDCDCIVYPSNAIDQIFEIYRKIYLDEISEEETVKEFKKLEDWINNCEMNNPYK